MDKNIVVEQIGNTIKALRIEKGLSQEELSLISKIDRGQISKIESGRVTGVTLQTIISLANALGYNLSFTKEEQKKIIHPFVKWAGGKTQLLDVICSHLPDHFNAYYEPFVGGGALLFKLQPHEFYINDSNKELMDAYKCFLSNESYEELINRLYFHELNHSENYYYQIREMDRNESFNTMSMETRAARMIYLNKACFNGLYRVNSKGYFNVASAKKDEVNCYDKENLIAIKSFFAEADAHITAGDFEAAVENAKEGDFVYFDPPRDVLDTQQVFTYTDEVFDREQQKRLADVFKRLTGKGVFVMMSNQNTELINELYADFNIYHIKSRKMANTKSEERMNSEEVIITNYK